MLFAWSPVLSGSRSQSLFWLIVTTSCLSKPYFSVSQQRGYPAIILTLQQGSESWLGTNCIRPSGLCWSGWLNFCSLHPYIERSWSIKILMFPSKGLVILYFLAFYLLFFWNVFSSPFSPYSTPRSFRSQALCLCPVFPSSPTLPPR